MDKEENQKQTLPISFKTLNTLKMNQFIKPGTKDILTPTFEQSKKLEITEVSSVDNTPVLTEKKISIFNSNETLIKESPIENVDVKFKKIDSQNVENKESNQIIEEKKEICHQIVENKESNQIIEEKKEISNQNLIIKEKKEISNQILEEKKEELIIKEEKIEEKQGKEIDLIKDEEKTKEIILETTQKEEKKEKNGNKPNEEDILEKRTKIESPTIRKSINEYGVYHFDLNLHVGSLTDTHKHDFLFGAKPSSITLNLIENQEEKENYKDEKTFSLHTRTNSLQEYQDFLNKFKGNKEKKDEPFDTVYSGAFNLVEVGLNIQKFIQKEKEEREKKKDLKIRKSFQIEEKKPHSDKNIERRLSEADEKEDKKEEEKKGFEKLKTKEVLENCIGMMNETHGFAWDFVQIGERIRQYVFTEKKSLLELAREKKEEIKAEIREKAIEKAEEIRERAKEKAEEIRGKAKERAEVIREELKEAAQEIKEKTTKLKEGFNEKTTKLREDFAELSKIKPKSGLKADELEFFEPRRDSINIFGTSKKEPNNISFNNKQNVETVQTELKNITLDEDEKELQEKQKNKLEQMLDNQKEWLNQRINLYSNQPSISISELLEKGKKNYHFINCFGLFDVTSFLTDALDEIALWELKDIEFKFGKPIIEGLLKGNSGDEYVKIENGFMNIYFGKKETKEIIGHTPNLSLNLREAIVRDKKYNEEEEAFKITVNLVDFRFYVKTKDLVEKWIWVIRMNSGFHRYRYNSFSPVRKNNGCQFLHCGKDYFYELSESIKQAKTEIFICGWLVTPQLYLKRNPNKERLDELLLMKAKEGVKIYILLWKDPGSSLIMDNGSIEAEIFFNNLHENIYCIRDPPSFGLIIWSHHQKCVIIDQDISFLGGIDIAYNRYEDPETYLLFDEKEQIYPGMDYVNPLLRMKTTGDYTKSYFDRKIEPRLPWNDIQVKIVGMASRDVSRNFIERWNFCVQSSKSSKPLIILSSNPYIKVNEKYSNCKVQILRSASSWGFGLDIVEKSIYDATIEIIDKAKSFIYIENQFFISGSKEKQLYPKNKITQALINKIRNAIKNKQEFKIIIMLPLQTANPIKDSTTLVITYWQYMSIYRGEDSFFGLLQKEFPKVDIDKYVTFTSMRNWSYTFNKKNATTEIIYIHSKMMIVDDRYVIIGSANINDRSMTGGRDSEIAAIIEDTEKIEIKMNGEPFIGNKFAHELRLNIWEKYLHSKKEDFKDPILYFNEWVKIAKNNTKIYNQVFGMIHSTIKNENDLHYLSEYNQILKAKNLEMLEKIKGHIVTFPVDFLSENSKAKGLAISDSQENLYYM